MTSRSKYFAILMVSVCMVACLTRSDPAYRSHSFAPSEVIDLGAVVTEDLPQQFWGKAFMRQMGFMKQNAFEVIKWTFPRQGGSIFRIERVLHAVQPRWAPRRRAESHG
jgi:hypothetical protein